MARAEKPWREVRRQRPLNEARIEYHGRVMEAERVLEALRDKRGVSEQRFDAAQLIDRATGEEETDDLARLARWVAVLGGRLELRAVFPEETVTLMEEPAPGAPT